jgi:alpha-L-fucosidase
MNKKLALIVPVIAALIAAPFSKADPPKPMPQYGIYFCFGLGTFAPQGPGPASASLYAPTGLDVRSWVRTAKQAGATYAVLTALESSGFCLWPAKNWNYSVAGSPAKTDVVAEFLAACKAEGIIPGIHFSAKPANEYSAVAGPGGPTFFEFLKQRLTDLHTRYPGIGIQLFDDAGEQLTPDQFTELCQIVKKLNPQCQITIHPHYAKLDPGHQLVDWFSLQDTVNKKWCWTPNAEIRPAQAIYKGYAGAVSGKRSFILNAGPDRSGRIPDNEVAVLMEMKKLIDGQAGDPTQPVPPQPSAPPASTTAAPNAGDTRTEKLKTLKQAFEQGLISKDAYDQKVKEILDEI